MQRDDPRYIEAVVRKKPHKDDPKDIAIREKIEEQVLREPWARKAFAKIRGLQIDYLKDAVKHADDARYVHTLTQRVLAETSKLLKTEIVEGAEYLKELPKGSPVLVMTNHLGAYKLAGINPKEDLGVDIPGYDFMYPFPLYFAGLQPVAQALGDNLYYVSDDFPGVFGAIHSESGFVHVPPPIPGEETKGRTGQLQEQTKKTIDARKGAAAIVNFPEGGTSGKYSGLGPYDLDPFKTGGYVVAAQLGIPVVHVVQYFDPNEGLKLKILKPYVPQVTDREGYQQYGEEAREEMQTWLDARK